MPRRFSNHEKLSILETVKNRKTNGERLEQIAQSLGLQARLIASHMDPIIKQVVNFTRSLKNDLQRRKEKIFLGDS